MVVELKVFGMHCGMCEGKVKKSLFSYLGVNNVAADRYTNSVKVDFVETEVSLDEIIESIEELGFKVEK